MAEPTTRTLETAGATLRYDVRPGTGRDPRPLLLIGSPMDATGFTTLASHFTDRTVVTYDPRGVGRSETAEGAPVEIRPEEHADDLARLIEELAAGPVDVFASSGGAVNALALVARRPELVHTLVAHEPPAAGLVPDGAEALAACEDVRATYLRDGWGAGMAKFIALTSHQGPIPAGWAGLPVPPETYGLPAEDDGRRDDPLLGRNMRGCTSYVPDTEALKAAAGTTRIVVAAGEESRRELAARAAAALAERLGTPLAVFPSHHGGFLGGEFGQRGAPEAFAKTLREVLEA
ncbi:alpha/beta hydrolase [Streptomyces sp. NPDC035033]|uniref:alpha/beta fold hydrolase n=1 Tax=Streptomyces sp. NPDC035033 TaxID=3155368 RepID=UPI0033DE0BE8